MFETHASNLRLATVYLNEIEQNLKEVRTELGTEAVLDFRANAFGHGLDRIAPLARDLGFKYALISNSTSRDLIESFGLGARFDPLPSPNIETRLGPELYGLAPNYAPAMSLVSCLLQTKEVDTGAGVSYGWSWYAPKPTRLGLIGIGYADGVCFQAAGKISIGDKNYPVRGRIAMDHLVVDLGEDSPPIGAEAVVWGRRSPQPTVCDWANRAGIQPLALTSCLAARVVKRWI